MSLNTIAINQRMDKFDGHHSVWLFGYGSLIFKPDFPYIARRPASIVGWTRRFWQGSHDHRGTPEAPGRVATLVPAPGARCAGMAYLITPEVFAHLDHREKNGYLRVAIAIDFADDRGDSGERAERDGDDSREHDRNNKRGGDRDDDGGDDDGRVDTGSVEGLVYLAADDNAAFLGAASERDIARQIAGATGPSGRNRDYLLSLADALRALGQDDPHVFAIEHHLAEFVG